MKKSTLKSIPSRSINAFAENTGHWTEAQRSEVVNSICESYPVLEYSKGKLKIKEEHVPHIKPLGWLRPISINATNTVMPIPSPTVCPASWMDYDLDSESNTLAIEYISQEVEDCVNVRFRLGLTKKGTKIKRVEYVTKTLPIANLPLHPQFAKLKPGHYLTAAGTKAVKGVALISNRTNKLVTDPQPKVKKEVVKSSPAKAKVSTEEEDDKLWLDLAAGLIFLMRNDTTYDKLRKAVDGLFTLTDSVRIKVVAYRTEKEAAQVQAMFSIYGTKFPSLTAVFHLLEYTRLSSPTMGLLPPTVIISKNHGASSNK